MKTKTIIIPCFNEIGTIKIILERVQKHINNNDNIIIVDDGSNDGTKDFLKSINEKNIIIKFHEVNIEKGKQLKLP